LWHSIEHELIKVRTDYAIVTSGSKSHPSNLTSMN
jgi:hypothetical protein